MREQLLGVDAEEFIKRREALGDRWAEVKSALEETLGPTIPQELENVVKENIGLAIEASILEFMEHFEDA